MATIGQCKACGHGVSDEAATCPRCGQPRPCLLAPPVGTVHQGRVTYAGYISWVTLSSGTVGSLSLSSEPQAKGIYVGASISVKIMSVSKDGIVELSLEI